MLLIDSVCIFVFLGGLNSVVTKCPLGAVQGPSDDDCYTYRTTSTSSWFFAEEECVSQYGHLASVQNAFVNSFLPRQACAACSNSGSTKYWLGASKGVDGGNVWTWTDGTNLSFTNWARDNSSAATVGSLCGALSVWNAEWYPLDCNTYLPYICKVPSTKESLPNCRPTCESGWTFYAPANMCYKAVYEVTFHEALGQCEAMGSTLASIHGENQNAFLAEHAASHYGQPTRAWIGMYDPQHTKDYHWTDGSPVNFTNWGVQQPDGGPDSAQHCGCIVLDVDNPSTTYPFKVGQWDDVDCTTTKYHSGICQKPAN